MNEIPISIDGRFRDRRNGVAVSNLEVVVTESHEVDGQRRMRGSL